MPIEQGNFVLMDVIASLWRAKAVVKYRTELEDHKDKKEVENC